MFAKTDKPKEYICEECNKTFSKASSFYNHRKITHNFRPTKENERGRPIKSEPKPFERKLDEILSIPRKIMQDKDFPNLAKHLLKIVRKEKDLYDKVFESLEKFDNDFESFIERAELLSEDFPGISFLRADRFDTLKLIYRTLLENWRLTLKLTDGFTHDLAILIGFFLENTHKMKHEIVEGAKEELGDSLNVIIRQKMNDIGGGDFIETFVEILFSWKRNYKL